MSDTSASVHRRQRRVGSGRHGGTGPEQDLSLLLLLSFLNSHPLCLDHDGQEKNDRRAECNPGRRAMMLLTLGSMLGKKNVSSYLCSRVLSPRLKTEHSPLKLLLPHACCQHTLYVWSRLGRVRPTCTPPWLKSSRYESSIESGTLSSILLDAFFEN